MLAGSLTRRSVNHARPCDVTEGYAANWTVEQRATECANDDGPEHAVMLRASMRW